jgi:hypothetical protein
MLQVDTMLHWRCNRSDAAKLMCAVSARPLTNIVHDRQSHGSVQTRASFSRACTITVVQHGRSDS